MEPVVDILSKRLRAYVDARHAGNISKAARILAPGKYYVVYRLYHLEQKGVHFKLAYELFKLIAPNDYREILREHFPKETSSAQFIASNGDDPLENLNRKLASIFQNQLSYKIYAEAYDGLLNLETLRDDYGRYGIEEFERLVIDGVLAKDPQGNISSTVEGILTPSEDLTKRWIQTHLEVLDAAQDGTLMKSLHANYNYEGIKIAYNKIQETTEFLYQLSQDERYRGGILFVASLLCGPYILRRGTAQ